MKLTEIANDAVTVRALLKAAEDVGQLLDARHVRIGVIDDTLVVIGNGPAVPGTVAVTVEERPRLVTLTPDPAPDDDTDDDTAPGPCLHAGLHDVWCVCLRSCCNARDGQCICLDCADNTHTHG